MEEPVAVVRLKNLRAQPGFFANAACDGGKGAQREMRAIRMHGGAVGGINLDVIDAGPGVAQLAQTVQVSVDLLRQRLGAALERE